MSVFIWQQNCHQSHRIVFFFLLDWDIWPKTPPPSPFQLNLVAWQRRRAANSTSLAHIFLLAIGRKLVCQWRDVVLPLTSATFLCHHLLSRLALTSLTSRLKRIWTFTINLLLFGFLFYFVQAVPMYCLSYTNYHIQTWILVFCFVLDQHPCYTSNIYFPGWNAWLGFCKWLVWWKGACM